MHRYSLMLFIVAFFIYSIYFTCLKISFGVMRQSIDEPSTKVFIYLYNLHATTTSRSWSFLIHSHPNLEWTTGRNASANHARGITTLTASWKSQCGLSMKLFCIKNQINSHIRLKQWQKPPKIPIWKIK